MSKKASKTVAKKSAVKKATVKRSIPKGFFALTDLAKELGSDGKTARRMVRASGEFKKSKDGWVFPAAKRRPLRDLLSKKSA